MSVIDLSSDLPLIGAWTPGQEHPSFDDASLLTAIPRVRETAFVVREGQGGRVGIAFGGYPGSPDGYPLLGVLPPLYPEWLGDRSFCETHGVRFSYIAGEMANGIASTRMVIAIGRAGAMGFFGAAGLSIARITTAIDELEAALGDAYAWGINLIHSPNEAGVEDETVALLLRRGVKRVSASAFMALTPAVVRYSAAGLSVDAHGQIHRSTHLFAKLSRAEVALRFMSPAPADILADLVSRGHITAEQAALAARVPVAEDVTVEADSGGHTDNQTLTALLPAILKLRDDLVTKYGFTRRIRVGAAGGIGTPMAVAAAYALGAAYVLTGSINQASIESALSPIGKEMLAVADIPDVTMGPSADMFELGVKVQVLKRGTMFASRASKLYEVYTTCASLDTIPADVRAKLEKDLFRASLDQIWAETRAFWAQRDPHEVTRAEKDPKHKMALVFRWYLGKSSRWAIEGDASRKLDYQVWCGPAMGAFNRWTEGSFLALPQNRTVVQMAYNLLEGAAVITRAQQLRTYGVPVPEQAFQYAPRPLE